MVVVVVAVVVVVVVVVVIGVVFVGVIAMLTSPVSLHSSWSLSFSSSSPSLDSDIHQRARHRKLMTTIQSIGTMH